MPKLIIKPECAKSCGFIDIIVLEQADQYSNIQLKILHKINCNINCQPFPS